MKAVLMGAAVLLLSGCSTLDKMVYRIDIPQGNYLEQRDIDKLRIGMSKEQVAFVLGKPVSANAFNQDVWHYVYQLDPNSGDIYRREAILTFTDGALSNYEGDFDLPEDFNTPLDQ
ncbi:outer membrane protein assembly factor BamE [Idiomarina xiamenensis]|uniref:Outer membrane protein assembly factor BamE n=1 Tax=Idiomarina xiamenensis 10-D-4 TaxID=740709 RepID=K2K7X9_9GAMM|nr:outer membrane protein assembly factor BamE [Idiomarina xiamenensis]EKE83798.1 Outer membrane lipoprotein OmlA (small protein A) [Idiomarina xiamenensis 10-D-4]